MIDIEDEESPLYQETKDKIVEILFESDTPMTIRQLKGIIKNDSFLADALNHLVFVGLIEDVGSLLIPKYKYLGKESVGITSKVCPNCCQEKKVIEFYLEWSGAYSKRCKACKIASSKKRGPKPKSLGKESSTSER
jgi:hypothetical protein